MKPYLKLLRVRHYVKNLLIFAPLFFGAKLFDIIMLEKIVYAFIPFCLGTSIVYIINDINDVDKDRNHPIKCKRPIASGIISIYSSKIILFLLLSTIIMLSGVAILYQFYSYVAVIWLFGYITLNILYSYGLKNIPVIDILILSAGFVIRLYYGSCITGVEISSWLYLTVLGGAFYLGMGKRRNELQKQKDANTRVVLKKYSYEFLDKNMHTCVAFTEVCYALWAVQSPQTLLRWTVPLIMVIFMRYSLIIETKESEGNPIEILFEDKTLLAMVLSYGIIVFISIYAI